MKATKFVDLSWDIISHNTPVFPGDPEPELNVVAKLASDGMNLSTLFTGTQSGSHVDAPYHCSDEGETIENMELDFFFGPAVVVRVTEKSAIEGITMEDLEPYKEKIKPGTIVLFNTDWYKKWGTDDFFNHPYITGEVGKYLYEAGVRFVAIDTMNVDNSHDPEYRMPVHELFAEKRLMIGENWCNFDNIDFENVWIAAFPMKLVGTDGSPVRAVAIKMEQ